MFTHGERNRLRYVPKERLLRLGRFVRETFFPAHLPFPIFTLWLPQPINDNWVCPHLPRSDSPSDKAMELSLEALNHRTYPPVKLIRSIHLPVLLVQSNLTTAQ